MSELPLVTVNILAFNRREEVRRTLEVIFGELDYPAERLEVIVVDNASSDGTGEMVRSEFPGALLIRNEINTGVSAWNRGFERGRGDWFLVLDDDCYLTGDALRRALDQARVLEADLVSFSVRSSVQPDFFFSRDYELGLLSFWGCSVLVSRRAIELLGGFDEEIFIWAHELEFTMRLLDAGLRHLHLPDIVSVHLKEPPPPLPPERPTQINVENFAYVAVKLLRAPDAALALWSLSTRGAIMASKESRWARILAGAVARGVRRGLRSRSPVRAEVSRLYRRNYLEYVNPVRFTRTPIEMFRSRGDRRAELDSLKLRQERFWREREELYPTRPTALRM